MTDPEPWLIFVGWIILVLWIAGRCDKDSEE
jgi:hypothetical protein